MSHFKPQRTPQQEGEENLLFSLKFLTWQNFTKHRFFRNQWEALERQDIFFGSGKKKPEHSNLRGLCVWGVACWGWITELVKVGPAHWATHTSSPEELQAELTYICFLLYRWNKLYMMEPPWSSVREAMSSTPSSFMGCMAVTFWWVIVLCL